MMMKDCSPVGLLFTWDTVPIVLRSFSDVRIVTSFLS
ncbi:hypothetical protein NT03LS_3228, partial [Listeria seeligeri FSL N1-067]